MQKSMLETVYLFTSKVILYLLKRQQTVILSTAKVKYYTLAKAISKVLWPKQIIG